MKFDTKLLSFNLRMLLTKDELTARELNDRLNFSGIDRVSYMVSQPHRLHITENELQQIADYFKITVADLTSKKADIIFK